MKFKEDYFVILQRGGDYTDVVGIEDNIEDAIKTLKEVVFNTAKKHLEPEESFRACMHYGSGDYKDKIMSICVEYEREFLCQYTYDIEIFTKTIDKW